MKKTIIALSALIMLTGMSFTVQGQEADTVKYWQNSGVFSLNMAQSSFTNWAAGGQNSWR